MKQITTCYRLEKKRNRLSQLAKILKKMKQITTYKLKLNKSCELSQLAKILKKMKQITTPMELLK